MEQLTINNREKKYRPILNITNSKKLHTACNILEPGRAELCYVL